MYAMYIVFRSYERRRLRSRRRLLAGRSRAGRVTVAAPSNDRRHGMGYVGKLLKSAVVAKAAQVAIREMSKPENQRKAKELLGRVTKRGGAAGRA